MRSSTNSILASAAFATLALARTDLEGCTRTDISSPAGASYAWIVPGTGELCDMLDCGGGRAPPKTTVPGCPQYSGTETYSPSYLAGYQASETSAPSTTAAVQSTEDAEKSTTSSFDWGALETDTAESSWDLYTTLASVTDPIPASSTPLSAAFESEVSSAVDVATSPASATEAATSQSSSLVAQTTPASNGTYSSFRPGSNGTISNGTATPSAPISDSGAAAIPKSWVGSAGLAMGLGAFVAAL